MTISFQFRKNAISKLTNQIGVYILCDLDNVPIYVGQSTDGIRSRVRRHLTSARSDIIANRQIDVWEIAFVRAYPVDNAQDISPLEARLFDRYNTISQLMNGTIPTSVAKIFPPDNKLLEPKQVIQVLSDQDIAERKDPSLRLPRQAAHYAQIVGHFLVVKNSKQIARAMDAHFKRLSRYHSILLGLGTEED